MLNRFIYNNNSIFIHICKIIIVKIHIPNQDKKSILYKSDKI